jgi:hypothetical protein
MPRYIVTVTVTPVTVNDECRTIMAVRSIRAAGPADAARAATLVIRRSFIGELGLEAVKDATFVVIEIRERQWSNRGTVETTFILPNDAEEDTSR